MWTVERVVLAALFIVSGILVERRESMMLVSSLSGFLLAIVLVLAGGYYAVVGIGIAVVSAMTLFIYFAGQRT